MRNFKGVSQDIISYLPLPQSLLLLKQITNININLKRFPDFIKNLTFPFNNVHYLFQCPV